MAVIRPFKALRPKPSLASRVASPPYDVLSSEEARIAAEGNPDSFLHITKPEIDLPADTDAHSEQVYERAKENLQDFRKRDVLFRDENPCYYIYMLVMDGRSQTGLVCVSSLDDYENGIVGIKGHRTVGGFRASLYNALPLESVLVLTELLKRF